MLPERTPTSSLSGTRTVTSYPSICMIVTSAVAAIELLVKRVWYRSRAEVHRIRSGDAASTPPTMRASPISRLPQDIIETIIAHLDYDMRSLRAFSLTCYSWYTAAVPHLHHTLSTTRGLSDKKFKWPNPIQHMHGLGLLPFVRTLFIQVGSNGNRDMFSPKQLSTRTLQQFSALTNVRQLMIHQLDLPGFMPRLQQCFGHFLPTVQELCLQAPKGSRRQIIYFIGLFKHLQDLYIINDAAMIRNEQTEDLALVPHFAPPLGGRLMLSWFSRVDLLRDMISLFGGIKFHTLDLFNVDGVPLLLNACAKTLTTLQLYPSDTRGRPSSLKGIYVMTNGLPMIS